MVYRSKETAAEEKKAMTSAFVDQLLSNTLLNKVWNMERPGNYKNAFNFAYKLNYECARDKHPTCRNYITPPNGFRLPKFTLRFRRDGMLLDLEPIKKTISKWQKRTGKDLRYSICAVLCHYHRIKKDTTPYALIPINHKPTLFNSEKILNALITFDKKEEEIALKYRRFNMYISFILQDEKGKIIAYSQTHIVSVRYR